jgi:proteasome lid subunit RPN8/RPN11
MYSSELELNNNMNDNVPVLKLNAELAGKIRDHGAETYPHECCGALLGKDVNSESTATSLGGPAIPCREVLGVFPLVNRRDDSPRNRFSVTAEDVLAAEKSAREQGMDLVGWYHSHPDHPARPSQYDRDHAWPWYSYVIVSVANGYPREMTSWRLRDDREEFSAEEIVVANQGAK